MGPHTLSTPEGCEVKLSSAVSQDTAACMTMICDCSDGVPPLDQPGRCHIQMGYQPSKHRMPSAPQKLPIAIVAKILC